MTQAGRAQGALLDVDGTLVDSNDFHVEAWRRAFAAAGIQIQKPLIHAKVGMGADMLVPSLAPGLAPEKQESIGKRHGRIFKEEFLRRVRPFSGAREFIAQLHGRGVKVVLASSSGQDEIEHYIGLLEIGDLIHAVTSKNEVDHTKPAPDVFRLALNKMAPLTAAQVVAVGDTPYDALAAAKSGISTIGLRTGGFADEDLMRAGVVALYDSIDDLRLKMEHSTFFMR